MVKWTNRYKVKASKNRNFMIYLSEADGGLFNASCLWYEGDRVLRAPEESGGLNIELKNICGTSEQEVMSEITAWANSKFGADVEITLVT